MLGKWHRLQARLSTITGFSGGDSAKRTQHMMLFGTALAGGLALTLLMGGTNEAPTPAPEEAAVSLLADSAAADYQPESLLPAEPVEEAFHLKSGETLTELFARAGIERGEAHAAVAALRPVIDLRRLKTGQDVRLIRASGEKGRIESLRMRAAFDREAVLTRTDEGLKAEAADLPTVALTHYAEGHIEDSLYLSAKRAGLPDKVIVDMIRLMSFDVDFERDIREGDAFEIYFERRYSPVFGDTDEGNILRAKLVTRRTTLEANRFVHADGEADYYDSEGKSTRKSIMLTPVDGARLTSKFGRRKHPVLGYTKMHKGLDFGAPRGTPVMAAGDGIVEKAGPYSSYGNYIRIRHGDSHYKTAYAHLNGFAKGVKAGARVRQGQIIGYVGTTGRSTGPHLHYEILAGNTQVNPLGIKLPTGRKLKGQEMLAFQENRELMLADIGQIRTVNTVLLAEATDAPEQENAEAPVMAGRR
ncbi:M23 family metallopeptidase [Gimibacter soli]|uniref:Peptidoglycan DD-metalloendopeptidase family protein n=1 Tax=Gimibacter soli TaxID=3024400 RepID=A0AAE9XUX6_9PROT|nr:peptidoglycan DD-metalloendopeptidase family protein [Gimibacter soli]WCL54138.1 peptidoglycan DD-metalloendopeptidase family protein [Gimibacter soli]